MKTHRLNQHKPKCSPIRHFALGSYCRAIAVAGFVGGVWASCAFASGVLPYAEVTMQEDEWKHVHAAMVYPQEGVRFRKSSALRYLHDTVKVHAVIESDYYEESETYRKYFQTSCEGHNRNWKCSQSQDRVQVISGPSVQIGEGIVGADVVQIARFLEFDRGPWRRKASDVIELSSLQLSQGGYQAGVAINGCYYTLSLTRENESFVVTWGGIKVCS